jgi:uncharacterized protein YqhQ
VSTASLAKGRRTPMVIALAVIGVIALVVGILYLVDGSALPGFLTAGSHVKKGNHLARGAVAAVIGLVALVGAWFMNKRSSTA